MDLSELWQQILRNVNASTICIRSNIAFVQDVPQTFYQNVSSTNYECSTTHDDDAQESENEIEEEDNSGEDEDEVETNDGDDEEGDVRNEAEHESNDKTETKTERSRKAIQRNRYLREEYRCVLCPYACTTEKAYLRHLRLCESKDIQFKCHPLSCPVCGKDRRDEVALSVHMKKHKIGKLFCCDLCKFKSVQLKKIIQHRRMHTGEKPHLCPHCNYRSSRRDNLRSHVRRVHKEENLLGDTFTPRSMLVTPTKRK